MNPSNNKNSITSIRWRDIANSKSNLMRRMLVTREFKEERKKRLFNFKEFNQLLKKFSIRFLKRVFTRKLEIR